MMTKSLILALISMCAGLACAQNIQNPVIKKVADAGVMKHNGKYYIGGVGTFGDVYVSSDLVNWGKPIHVVTMDNEWTRGTGASNNQIHANDMIYLNGDFHLYWSVNYWGTDRHAVHIVHSMSQNALGPYYESDKTTWLDNRIDPKVFRDDDGQLYMYMVRFTDGNTIWCRKMKNPAEFSGDPIYMFSSQPCSWETMDNRVIEGPWVMKYRDQYYMMYNANHTGHTWGNYQLGVAQADSPIAFNTGNKYSYPVVGSNQTAIDENQVDLLRYSATQGYSPLFSYTEQCPNETKWTTTVYDDSSWKQGMAGFAFHDVNGSTTHKFGTKWESRQLWLRKAFSIDAMPKNIALRVTHYGDTRIMLNGRIVYDKKGSDYCIINLTEDQCSALVKGDNLLAVETNAGRRGGYFNAELFDMGNETADEILYTPGQPNILRGPNGFEWWLIYMANRNDASRDQYIDRVQFFDRRLWVDGITGPNTGGYHPTPAMPTYSQLKESDAEGAFNTIPSVSYLMESGVKTTGNAGVIAWWLNESNYARVGLDAESRTWYLSTVVDGKSCKQSFNLPSDFRWGVYHSVRVERNGADLKVWIDDIKAPGGHELSGVIPCSPGVAGTFDELGSSKFEGAIYTIGFDDVNVRVGSGEKKILGDALTDYEMSAQLYGMGRDRSVECYLAYVDEKNNVSATFNGASGTVDVKMKQKGKTVYKYSYALANERTLYSDVKYTDSMDKGYRFESPTWLNAIYLNRHEVDRHGEFVDNMFDKMTVEYLFGGKWHALDRKAAKIAENPKYNVLNFEDVKAEGLRFINIAPNDQSRHIYKIKIGESLKESYNIRTVRRGSSMYLFIDGLEIAKIDMKQFPASKVGFAGGNFFADFRGMLYYHIGQNDIVSSN